MRSPPSRCGGGGCCCCDEWVAPSGKRGGGVDLRGFGAIESAVGRGKTMDGSMCAEYIVMSSVGCC